MYRRFFNPIVASRVLLARIVARQRTDRLLKRSGAKSAEAAHLLHLPKQFPNLIPEHAELPGRILDAADRIIDGRFSIFSKTFVAEGMIPEWNRDYVFDRRWEESSTSKTPATSDIKTVWELNRLQFLPTLGLAYSLTHERKYVDSIKSTLLDWIGRNPVHSRPNWDSAMEVALRSVSILITLCMIEDETQKDKEFRDTAFRSLFEHGAFIHSHLEIGVFGTKSNHFFSDLIGLLLLGLVFRKMKIGDRWHRYALRELEKGMRQHVDDDGVYFEHSTSYHRLVLEIFMYSYLIGKLNNVIFSKSFISRLERMFEFTWWYTRPDGLAVQAGDADDGRVFVLTDYFSWDRRDHRYLLQFAGILFDRVDLVPPQLPSRVELLVFGEKDTALQTHSAKSGPGDRGNKLFEANVVVRRNGGDYLFVTAWDVGTDGIGNHQHNDILSFELTLDGIPFVVDPGSYCYTYDSKLRNLFRSTGYHNTVQVDDSEINRFDPRILFRMSDDTKPQILDWGESETGFRCTCRQGGYKSSGVKVIHERDFRGNRESSRYEISDRVAAAGSHLYSSSFHLDHGVRLERHEGHFVMEKSGVRVNLTCDARDAKAETLDGWVSYSYLEKLPAKILRFTTAFQSSLSISYAIQKL